MVVVEGGRVSLGIKSYCDAVNSPFVHVISSVPVLLEIESQVT